MTKYIVIFVLLLSYKLYSATNIAANVTYSVVSNTIANSSSGDTVLLPPGSALWTSSMRVTGKSLNIIGSGIGQTIIVDGTGTSSSAFNISADPPNFVRLSGISFQSATSHDGNGSIVHFDGTICYIGFRMDNCSFTVSDANIGHLVLILEDYGLIDHCQFIVNATGGSIQCISPYGSSDSNDQGYTPWIHYSTNSLFKLGDTNALFIEDNSFYYNPSDAGTEDAIDGYGGARVVIRHNTFTNQSIGFHGLDSGSRRSMLSFEIYSNSFINNSLKDYHAGATRGGTGVVFGNTYGGTHGAWSKFDLELYRAVNGLDQSSWQNLDGTQWLVESATLSANGAHIANTYPTATVGFNTNNNEQLGTYTVGGLYSRFLDGSGNCGYPGRDQPGIAPGQVSYPVYCWDNNGVTLTEYNNNAPAVTYCGSNLSLTNWILEGRDYSNSVSAPAGYSSYIYPHPSNSVASVNNFYVDATQTTNIANGLSWANAWPTLQRIPKNLPAGSTVWISGGNTNSALGYIMNSSLWSTGQGCPPGGTDGNSIIYSVGTDTNHDGIVYLDCGGEQYIINSTNTYNGNFTFTGTVLNPPDGFGLFWNLRTLHHYNWPFLGMGTNILMQKLLIGCLQFPRPSDNITYSSQAQNICFGGIPYP